MRADRLLTTARFVIRPNFSSGRERGSNQFSSVRKKTRQDKSPIFQFCYFHQQQREVSQVARRERERGRWNMCERHCVYSCSNESGKVARSGEERRAATLLSSLSSLSLSLFCFYLALSYSISLSIGPLSFSLLHFSPRSSLFLPLSLPLAPLLNLSLPLSPVSPSSPCVRVRPSVHCSVVSHNYICLASCIVGRPSKALPPHRWKEGRKPV